MTTNNTKQMIETYKGKGDLISGIIAFVIGIFITRRALTYTMLSPLYDDTGAGIVWFGIILIIFGIILMIHYAAKKPMARYSDGTTQRLNTQKK